MFSISSQIDAYEEEQKKKKKKQDESLIQKPATEGGMMSISSELDSYKPEKKKKKPSQEAAETQKENQKSVFDRVKEGATKVKDFFLGKPQDETLSPVPKEIKKPDEVVLNDEQYNNMVVGVQMLLKTAENKLVEDYKRKRQLEAREGMPSINMARAGEVRESKEHRAIRETIANEEKSAEIYRKFLAQEPYERGFIKALSDVVKNAPRALTGFEVGEEIRYAREINSIVKKKNSGEKLNEYETSLYGKYQAFAIDELAKRDLGYQIGRMFGDSITFVTTYALTGGLRSGVSAATKASLAKSKMPNVVKGLAGWITGNLVAGSVAQAPRIAADTSLYMLPETQFVTSKEGALALKEIDKGDSFKKALSKAYLSNVIEYASESTGRVVTDAPYFIKNAILSKFVTNTVKKTGKKATSEFMKKLIIKTGWDGIIEEVFEEEINEIAQAPIQERKYYAPLLTPEGNERLLVETLGITVMSGIYKTADIATRGKAKDNREVIEIKATDDGGAQPPDDTGGQPPATVPDVIKQEFEGSKDTTTIENKILYRGTKADGKSSVEESNKTWGNVLVVDTNQVELINKLAEEGNEEAKKLIQESPESKVDFTKADSIIKKAYKGKVEAIQYNNNDPKLKAQGVTYYETATGNSYAENAETAKAYSLQNRAAKYDTKKTESASDLIKRIGIDPLSVEIVDDVNSIVTDTSGNKAALIEIPLNKLGNPKFETAGEYKSGRKITDPIEVELVNGVPKITDGANRFTQAKANNDKTIPVIVSVNKNDSYIDSVLEMRKAIQGWLEEDVSDKRKPKTEDKKSDTKVQKKEEVEIVNEKPITIFRAEDSKSGVSAVADGTYFAETEEGAKQYGDIIAKSTIPKGAKILNFDTVKNNQDQKLIPQEVIADPKKLGEWAKEKGYDYIKNTNTKGVEYVQLSTKIDGWEYDSGAIPGEPVAFNKQYGVVEVDESGKFELRNNKGKTLGTFNSVQDAVDSTKKEKQEETPLVMLAIKKNSPQELAYDLDKKMNTFKLGNIKLSKEQKSDLQQWSNRNSNIISASGITAVKETPAWITEAWNRSQLSIQSKEESTKDTRTENRDSEGTFLRGDKDKAEAMQADIAKGREYKWKYNIGDKVATMNGNVIIGDRYIEEEEARYTVYPAGKSKSYGYHYWVKEDDVMTRDIGKVKEEAEALYQKALKEKARLDKLNPNREITQAGELQYLTKEEANRLIELNSYISSQEDITKEEAQKNVMKKREQYKNLSIPEELSTYLKNSYDVTVDNAKAQQLRDAITRTKTLLLDPTEQYLQKVGSKARGVDLKDLETRPALLYKTPEVGVFTDGYLLINDKKTALAEGQKFINRSIEKLAKEEANNNNIPLAAAREKIRKQVMEADYTYPKYKELLADIQSKKGRELKLRGYYNASIMTGLFTDGDNRVVLNIDKYAYMQSLFPNATLYNTSQSAVMFEEDGKLMGVIMPILEHSKKFPIDAKGRPIEKETKEFKTPSGNAMAGVFSDIKSTEHGISNLKGFQFPEIVRLAKELTGGKTPEVRRYMGNALGKMYGIKNLASSARIALLADIFKDPIQAAKTLAHEIGHLVDFLPDARLDRGNLLGRLATLTNFTRQTFSSVDNEAKVTKLIKARKELSRQRKWLKDEDGNVTDKTKDRKLYSKIVELNKQIKKLRVAEFKDPEIRDELFSLSKAWRPMSENPESKELDYRGSSKEIYADTISVLINDPDLFKEKAPKAWRMFFDNLDRKPAVKKGFFDLWELLNKGHTAILTEREKEIQGMFKKGEDLYRAKFEEKNKREYDYAFMLKYEFVDKNQAIIDKINQAKKEGKTIADEDNPQYFLEGYNYVSGKLKYFLEKNIQPIYTAFHEAEIDWSNFGEYLFLERVINERGEFANPLGQTPETAKEQIQFMKERLGNERFKIIEDNTAKFREAIKTTLDLAQEAGLYSEDLVKILKANPAYATFQVLDYLDDYITPQVKKQIGTLKEISNPADATILKTLSLIRASERNMVKRKIVDFMSDNFSNEITPAKTIFNGKSQVPIEPKERGLELFTVFVKGKYKGYYVDQYVARTMNTMSVGQANVIVRTLSFFNGKLFRPLFITFNTGFQTFNLLRDYFRFWKNIPEMKIGRALKYYAKALPVARRRAWDIPDETIQEMENSEILSITFNDIIQGAANEDTQIERVLKKYDVVKTQTVKHKLMKPFTAILDLIEKTGNFIETVPKVAAYYYLNENKEALDMSQQQIAQYIRTKAGSPDFLRKGAGYYWSNNVLLFSNAIKEGMRADLEVATNPRTRAGYWIKTAMLNFVPKMIMFAALYGLLGDKNRELMNKVSEYDKTNYTIIPLGEDENGKAIYIRIPSDETGRFLGGLFWKALRLGNNDQTIMQNLTDVVSYTGGQLPSITPVIDLSSAWGQFLAGQNPYDFFYGRNVIPEEQYKAGGKEALKPMLVWSFQKLGGNVFLKMYSYQQAPESKSWQQKVTELPIVSNILGRWVRVSDYGVKESLRQQKQLEESQAAKERLDKKQTIFDYVGKYRENPTASNRRKLEQQLIRDVVGKPPYHAERARERTLTIRKFRTYVMKGTSPFVDEYLNAVSNDQKLIVLQNMKASVSNDEYKSTLKVLRQQKLISLPLYQKALKIKNVQ